MKIRSTKLIEFCVILLLGTFTNCMDPGPDEDQATSGLVPSAAEKGAGLRQLNISVLLDLSDRLIQPMQPSQQERDLEIISGIERVLRDDMDKKGAYMSKGKLKILLAPPPSNPSINSIVRKLRTDLSAMDNQEKKKVYDQLDSLYYEGISLVYDLTMKEESWSGSDIWRFFKNDVRDLCIEKDHRNVLVILTDGYIYHKNSTGRLGNRTEFVTAPLLRSEGFQNGSDWKKKFDEGDYGLKKIDHSLNDLEVLVLEVNPSSGHENDEDIIRAYWDKWFREMGVKDHAIYNTALPVDTKLRIQQFFE